jgi:hypothetical protein
MTDCYYGVGVYYNIWTPTMDIFKEYNQPIFIYAYFNNLYNVFDTYPIKLKPTHVKRCI